MCIGNAIHICELILLVLIERLTPGVAWGKEKYLSEYEYPEIPLLFSCKEEAKEKDDVKSGINRNVQDKFDFSISLDTKSISPLRGADHHTGNDEKLKPWMRGRFADETKADKEANYYNEKYSYGKLSPVEEEEDFVKNIPVGEISMNEEGEKSLYQNEEKSKKSLISDDKNGVHNEKKNAAPFETRKHKQVKKTMRVRQKGQNHDKIVSFKEGDKRIKSQITDSGQIADSDFSSYQRRYSYPEETNVIQKQMKLKIKKNINQNLYCDSIKSPEDEGNIQEYDELTNNKNDVIAINENLPPHVTGSHFDEDTVANRAQKTGLKLLGSDLASEKLENPNLKNAKSIQATHNPSRDPPHSALTDKNVEALNDKRLSVGNAVLPESPKEATSAKAFSSDYSDMMTPLFLLPIPERNNVLSSNVSKTKEVVLGDIKTAERQPKRGTSLQDNNLLLAKPPVKIANTLIEKHSEEDIENAGVEEHGTKVVKLMPMSSVTQPTTALFALKSANFLIGVPPNKKYQEPEANHGQQPLKNHPFHKSKRHIQDNKVAIPPEDKGITATNENSLAQKPPEDENNIDLVDDLKPNVDTDETSGISNDKLIEPQFYSMSNSKSALAQISSLFDKLKPNRLLKKTRAYEEKANDSVKRSVPQIYDQEYDSGYDYYTNKGGKEGAPLQSYYDYDNEYDLDYNDGKDYPRISRYNNSTALEKESGDYGDGKNYGNQFPKMKKKSKKQNPRKVEESYRDIFAHPLSLDDPELQIVRDDSVGFVRYPHHKNQYQGRRQKAGRNGELFPQNQEKAKPMDADPGLRTHLRKKKGEFAPHYHHYIVKGPQPFTHDEISNKESHIQDEKENG